MQPTEEFFSLVLPTHGTRVLCELTDKGVRNHTYVEGTSYTEIAADALAIDAKGHTVYMALGGFEHETVAKFKGRTADNARWFRALWLDIDVGENKDYKTLQEATDAFTKFVNEVGLPAPMMVHSGYGWHVYWPLATDLHIDDWRPAATGLKALALARGLRIDETATADAARILRPVGTHNYKRAPSKEVRLIKISETVAFDALKALLPAVPAIIIGTSPARVNGTHAAAFGLGAVDVSRPSNFNARKIIKGCQQFTWAYANQAAGVPEPMWRAMVGTLKLTDEPDIIHEFSRGDPRYTPEQTEAKAAGWGGVGVTCKVLEGNRAEGCIGCPQKGKITSPSWFGAQNQELLPAKIDEATGMPEHWLLLQDTLHIRSDDGPQLLYNGVIEFGQPFKERDIIGGKNDIQYLPVLARTAHDRHELFLHLGYHASLQDLKRAFSTVGIIPEMRQEKEFFNGMRAWIQQITDGSTSVKPVRQMGWQSHESSDVDAGFVLGTTLYTPGDAQNVRVDVAAEKHSRHMRPHGSFDLWRRAINMYNRPEYRRYALMSWLMFGAPLARLLGTGMPIAHFNSQGSGHGKTGTQDLLLSGAGNPRDPNGRWTGNTTIISIYAYLTAMNGNVAILDETSAIAPETLGKLMFEATLGSGRKAMQGASGQTRDLPPITGILCTSGNVSLQQLAQTMKGNSEAQVARVFEFNVVRPNLSKEQRYADAKIFELVYDHYGHAMPVYIRHVVDHQAEMKRLLAGIEQKLVHRFGMENEERFWRSLLAVCITGAITANQIGIIDHDINALLPAAYDHFNYQRNALTDEIKGNHSLYQFVQDNQSSVLVVDTDTPLQSGQLKLVTGLRLPASHINVRMRYVQDTSELWVDRKFLRAYCSEKNLDFRMLIADAQREGWLITDQERRDLTAFTKLGTPARVICCAFNMDKAKEVVHLLRGK